MKLIIACDRDGVIHIYDEEVAKKFPIAQRDLLRYYEHDFPGKREIQIHLKEK